MKLSTVLFLTDILPHRRRLFHKIVKNKIFVGKTQSEVFKTLKKCGFDGIELFLPQFRKVTDQDLHEVKKILDKYDISVLSVHQQLRFFTKTKIKEITELFSVADIFKTKIIVLHMNSAGRQIFSKEYVDIIHSLQKKYDIKVGFENMEKFFGSLHRGHSWHEDEFSELMKKNNFFITYDVQHLAHSGGDIIEFFKKNKQRIINIHLSDYRNHILNTNLRPLRYKHLPLGKGTLSIEKFLKVLKKEKYNDVVTFEMHTNLDGVCESAEIFNSVIKK
jgi:sugar phosphate isomerase/epimerase